MNQSTALGAIAASLLVGGFVAAAGSSGGAKLGDFPVFALCAVLAFAINWASFLPAYRAQTERFYDLTGSITYLSITTVGFLAGGRGARATLLWLLVIVWAVRLGSFLFRRVRRDGGDSRFAELKTRPAPFLMMWSIQALWVLFTVACGLAAITTQDAPDLDAWAAAGVSIWLAGFVIEVVADQQKSAFRADATNKGRFISHGLWAWSRHPNYFGEIVLWVGIAVIAIPTLSGWRWVTLGSPLFVYLLLTRVSGIPLQERQARKRWADDADYQRHVDTTPVLVMRPPR